MTTLTETIERLNVFLKINDIYYKHCNTFYLDFTENVLILFCNSFHIH